ncbi:zinc transporter ZIP1-like [Dermacentor variabilis]|uniref:zinc transporter ZIP1-like n=1 Tax=Dermacentor variabilis TaxID=34621 RepID=UPI003F5C1D95
MASSADKDVTLVQIQTALFGLSLNCAVYGVAYTVAASACVDNGQQGGFGRRTRGQRHRRDCGGARALSYVRCFTAGVFLGTLFLAMMPAVRAAVQAAQEEHKTVRGAFPFAEALVFACYCAALYADGMIAAATRRAGAPSRDSVRESPAAPRAEPTSPSSDSDLIDSPENSRTRLLREEDPQQNWQQRSYTVATPSERGIVTEPSSYCGSDDDTDADGPSAASRLAFTVAAMAVHSVLEGLAIGLQDNAVKLVWLVVGVYMRETLMTVAVALYAAAMEHSSIVAASAGLVVASTVPAGQMAGLLMGRQIGTLAKAFVQALATGIFFHVTFMEVLPPKMNRPQERIFKVTFMIIGFALIATADITSSHIAVAYA